MAVEWLTYAELGNRIGISPEAARQRAMRLKLRRQVGNDGKARIAVDFEEITLNPPKTTVEQPSNTQTNGLTTPVEQELDAPSEHPSDARLHEALHDQVAFFKEQLARIETLAEQRRVQAEQERGRVAELTADLRRLADRAADAEKAAGEADRARAAAVTELNSLRDKMQRAERDRDRLAGELATHLALPWWRKLFA